MKILSKQFLVSRKIGYFLPHPVVSLFLVILIFVQSRLFTSLFVSISLLIIVTINILSIFNTKNKLDKIRMALLNMIAIIVIHGAIWSNVRYSWIQRAQVVVGTKNVVNCRLKSVYIYPNDKFAVCSTDNDWWQFNFSKALIYDETGQIKLQAGERSKEWNETVVKMQAIAPFGIVGFTVADLGHHYYSVIFDNNLNNLIKVD